MEFNIRNLLYESRFYNSSQRNMDLEAVFEHVINFIKKDCNSSYRLSIGSDSQVKNDHTVFVTAIVIHRIGTGAWGCVNKIIIPYAINDLKEKLVLEANLTLQIVTEISNNYLEKLLSSVIYYLDDSTYFYNEIHIDIGKKGKSKTMIKEIIKYFSGLGFETRIKPDSYAASSYANKYTK
ncbi:ribonuclease H-like YkuK family protein [Clostridiaceae bacterium M8S5]|nr:ribonuclease H-like YkuK family protein [Clostridiaceae bacterium M8S5]